MKEWSYCSYSISKCLVTFSTMSSRIRSASLVLLHPIAAKNGQMVSRAEPMSAAVLFGEQIK